MVKREDCEVCHGTGEIRVHIAGSYYGTRPDLDQYIKCDNCKEDEDEE